MTTVKIHKALALKLLDWHGGQGSGLYAAGSTALAGRPVPIIEARRATRELLRLLPASTPAERREINKLVAHLDRIVVPAASKAHARGDLEGVNESATTAFDAARRGQCSRAFDALLDAHLESRPTNTGGMLLEAARKTFRANCVRK